MITDIEPLSPARLRLIDAMIDRAEVVRGPVCMEWRDARALYETALSTEKTLRIEGLEGQLQRTEQEAKNYYDDLRREWETTKVLREQIRRLEGKQ